ncbi:unnamed protein product [Gongylonema pulchrum]|uniref:Uncharacterized protein n=1 Tax=Gongylonema pulchrum TaxID=637853 RepID=A0A183E3R6_9BILA|nr:unnamed protein product [Gongylonema pulchrum]
MVLSAQAQKPERLEAKSSNFQNSSDSSSTSSVENVEPERGQPDSTPPPLPSVPPPQLLNQQFGSSNDDVLGITTQRHWTTTKTGSSNIKNSTMSTKVETTVRQWSTPVEKVIEGQPPRPVSRH